MNKLIDCWKSSDRAFPIFLVRETFFTDVNHTPRQQQWPAWFKLFLCSHLPVHSHRGHLEVLLSSFYSSKTSKQPHSSLCCHGFADVTGSRQTVWWSHSHIVQDLSQRTGLGSWHRGWPYCQMLDGINPNFTCFLEAFRSSFWTMSKLLKSWLEKHTFFHSVDQTEMCHYKTCWCACGAGLHAQPSDAVLLDEEERSPEEVEVLGSQYWKGDIVWWIPPALLCDVLSQHSSHGYHQNRKKS